PAVWVGHHANRLEAPTQTPPAPSLPALPPLRYQAPKNDALVFDRPPARRVSPWRPLIVSIVTLWIGFITSYLGLGVLLIFSFIKGGEYGRLSGLVVFLVGACVVVLSIVAMATFRWPRRRFESEVRDGANVPNAPSMNLPAAAKAPASVAVPPAAS